MRSGHRAGSLAFILLEQRRKFTSRRRRGVLPPRGACERGGVGVVCVDGDVQALVRLEELARIARPKGPWGRDQRDERESGGGTRTRRR